MLRKLFKGGNNSRAEFIRGNMSGKVWFLLIKWLITREAQWKICAETLPKILKKIHILPICPSAKTFDWWFGKKPFLGVRSPCLCLSNYVLNWLQSRRKVWKSSGGTSSNVVSINIKYIPCADGPAFKPEFSSFEIHKSIKKI